MVKICGFASDAKATCVDLFAIAAGGLHAKRHLSFNAGVFVDIEPLKAVRRVLWEKQKLKALSFKMIFDVVPAFSPETDEMRCRAIR